MISIVIPTFNESGNIEKVLARVDLAMNKIDQNYEIIVIDDHSTDGTWEILQDQRAKSNYPLRNFKKEGKKGKAYSLFEGFEKAKGEILVMIDSDLQYPPEAIPEMVGQINENTDIIVGNRKSYLGS